MRLRPAFILAFCAAGAVAAGGVQHTRPAVAAVDRARVSGQAVVPFAVGEELVYRLSPRPLDDVSFIYHVRTLPLRPGDEYVEQRYYKSDGNPVVVRVLRRERIDVPAGTFDAVVVRPIIRTSGLFGEGGDAEVWLSDDERRLVLRLRARVKGANITMDLESYSSGRRAGLDEPVASGCVTVPEADPFRGRKAIMKSKSPAEMMSAVTESMKSRTGRTLEEWVGLVQASGLDPLDQNAVRRWLAAEHGVKQNTQWAIADAAAGAAGWRRPSVEEYIDAQYAGPKAELRPIFDRIREIILTFGDDIGVEGRGTYTPFVRRRQFAAVAAATRTRVDVGLRFSAPPQSPLLEPAKAPGQATHRLSLRSADEITAEVERLLLAAYEQNA